MFLQQMHVRETSRSTYYSILEEGIDVTITLSRHWLQLIE